MLDNKILWYITFTTFSTGEIIHFNWNPCDHKFCVKAKDFPMQISQWSLQFVRLTNRKLLRLVFFSS